AGAARAGGIAGRTLGWAFRKVCGSAAVGDRGAARQRVCRGTGALWSRCGDCRLARHLPSRRRRAASDRRVGVARWPVAARAAAGGSEARGGLAALARDAPLRSSSLGLISVGLLIATGIVNGWILAGSVPALIGTDYGRLLLAKVALFLAMVAVAAVNRLRLTPRLALAISSPPCGQALAHRRRAGGAAAGARPALRALARHSLVEATFGLAILTIVGALGTLPPGAHVLQPTWPFVVRYSNAAFGDAELRAALVLALWAVGGGLLCGAMMILIGA